MKRLSDTSLRIQEPGGRVWPRVILIIVLIAVAAGAFSYGIWSLLYRELGWQQIDALSPQTAATAELSLYYPLQTRQEQKALPGVYTQAADRAYKIFSGEPYDGIQGLGYLNNHPGETVTVEPELYRALECLESEDSRYLYYAPVYERYRGLYSCQEDSETVYFDPALSPEIAAYLEEVRAFAADPSAIQVALKGANQVELTVSPAYREFARENGIEAYLDFFWLQNAFTVDAVADALTQAGFSGGIVRSFEGFTRVLGAGDYTLSLYTRRGDTVYQAAQVGYAGPKSAVVFRNFPLNPADRAYYYLRADGTARTPFIAEADSLCHGAVPSLAVFSQDQGCGPLAAALLPIYTSDTLREEALAPLGAVWDSGSGIVSAGPGVTILEP